MPHIVNIVMNQPSPCRICARTIAVGDHALHLLWGAEYACITCGYYRADELNTHPTWMSVMRGDVTEARARWLELNSYATLDEVAKKVEWTELGRKRRDEWLSLRKSSAKAGAPGS